jgi:LPXTG-motif cell wall-anchored protein
VAAVPVNAASGEIYTEPPIYVAYVELVNEFGDEIYIESSNQTLINQETARIEAAKKAMQDKETAENTQNDDTHEGSEEGFTFEKVLPEDVQKEARQEDSIHEETKNTGEIEAKESADSQADDNALDSPEVHFEDQDLANLIAGTLAIHGRAITEADMAELTELSIDEFDSKTIDSLEGIQYAKQLKVLDLTTVYRHSITDISALSGLKELETLSITRSSISDISSLSGLTNLKHLNLEENEVTDISPLANLTNLESVDLYSNSVSDISALANLTKLEDLDINANSVSDIRVLSDKTNLTELSLGHNEITDISSLAKLTNLELLSITGNQVASISPLAGLHHIETLYIEDNKITDISPLANMDNLKVLFADSNYFSDISSISELDSIEQIEVSFNPISDISVLKEVKTLTNVYVVGTRLSDTDTVQYLINHDVYVAHDLTLDPKEWLKKFPEESGFTVSDETVSYDLNASADNQKITLTAEQQQMLIGNNRTLTLSNGEVQVAIPSTVFDNPYEEVTIEVKEQDKAADSLSAAYDFTIRQEDRTISKFEPGITLTFDVDSSLAENADNLKVFYLNEDTGQWEKVGGTYQDGKVTAVTNHFSTFAVFEIAGEEGASETVVSPAGTSDGGKAEDIASPAEILGGGNKEGTVSLAETVNDDDMEETSLVKKQDNTTKSAKNVSAADVRKSADSENTGKETSKALPDTSTNTFNWLLSGALMLLLGVVIIYFYARKKKISQ